MPYHYQCQQCGAEFTSDRRNRQFCSRACQNRANNANAGKRRKRHPLVTAWACGGGVDSTAVAALIVEGKLPKPDLAYMTDCGWDSQETWEYVHGETIPRLRAVGVELQIVKSADYSDAMDVITERGHVVIPAFTMREGKRIRFRTHCSANWKSRVARRWLREQGVKRCDNWVGVAADEAGRRRRSPVRWCRNVYPLIELGMTREDCQWFIGYAGWPKAPRSSCIICPQQSDTRWQRMKRFYPADWERAVAMEQRIHEQRPDVFLHNSLVPLPEVQFPERPGALGEGVLNLCRSDMDRGGAKAVFSLYGTEGARRPCHRYQKTLL